MTQKLTRCEQSDFIWTSWSRFVNRKRRERERRSKIKNWRKVHTTWHYSEIRGLCLMECLSEVYVKICHTFEICTKIQVFFVLFRAFIRGKTKYSTKKYTQKFSFQFESTMTFNLAQTSYFCRMFYLTGLVKSTFSTFFVHFKLCGIPSEK